MVRALILFLIVSTLATVAGAQSYTVSGGSLGSYADLSSPTQISLGAGSLSSVISPSGFSFSYFGNTYTDFKIGSGGYMLMGTNGTVIAKFAQHTTAPGLAISPNWNYLEPGVTMTTTGGNPGPGTVGWEFSGGVLTVEWKNVAMYGSPARGVRMQAVLNTGSGEIEFRYGDVPAGASGAIANYANTAAISGPTSGISTTQEIINGFLSGYTGTNGEITAYPAKNYIRFTPAGGGGNVAPTISVTQGGSNINNGGGVNVNYSDTVTGLNFVITVDDANGDPVDCSASISNLGSTGIVVTEWEITAGTVSYQLTPTSGTFNTPAGVTHAIDLQVDDGQLQTNFSFTINQAAQSTSAPLISVSDGATVSPGQSAAGTARDFGSRDITAGQSTALVIAITNSGTASLTLSNFGMTGDAGEFVLDTNGITSPLAAGNSTTFTVAFDPTSPGQKVAQVTFNHDDTTVANPFTFEVTGLGTSTTTAPLIVVKETSTSGAVIGNGSSASGIRAFGSMDLSATPSLPITIFVENAGTATLTVGTPASSNGDFTVNATGFPSSLGVGANATFTVTFTPSGVGAKSANIQFTHDDTSTTIPFSFEVTGTATSSGGGGGPGPGGLSGGGGGGGGGGCAADVNALDFLLILFVLGAGLGARTWRRRATR